MFLVMARFARWVHESIANIWPRMVQDSSVESFVPAYATPARVASACSDHSSANATCTLCAQWRLRWPRWRRWPQWPGPHREHPWHHWHPCHRPHRWWHDVWWQFHPLRCRRRRLFRVQFPQLQFMACLWLHGLYGMQAGIGETKNGFGKKLGSNEDRGTSSPFSLPETDQTTYKVSEFQNGYGYWCCSWMFSGFQRNDNMFLDVSGQVRKLHSCIAANFHPMSRAPGIGMPLPCGHFYCFLAPSLVLRCGIGSEMSTSNFKTTLHKVFGSCFRNKRACPSR